MFDAEVQEEVFALIKRTESDFHLTETLVDKLSVVNIPRAQVIGALDVLFRERLIRHPVGFNTTELDWWRPVSRGFTRGEKLRMTKALFGMYPVSDGEFNGPGF